MTTWFGSGWENGDILLRRDLVAQGMTDTHIHAMVRRGGLRRLAHGVLAVGPSLADPREDHAQRAAGLARRHPSTIALSHHSGLSHVDLPLDGYVDLRGPIQAVRLSGAVSTTTALRVWRPRTPPPTAPLEGGGLVVVPVHSALQVAMDNPLLPAVVVLDACLHAGMFERAELVAALETIRHAPGVGAARVAVARSRDGSQSPKETELRLLVEDLGYQTQTQFPISAGPDEPPFAYADLRITGTRALLEYDGEDKYASGDASPLLAERGRERRIERLGWGIERVVARDLRTRQALARRIEQLVQQWPEAA